MAFGAGPGRVSLVEGIHLLHPQDAVLSAMLEGFANQQLGGRGLAPKTVSSRETAVKQFQRFTNDYPWSWTAAQVDEWSTTLVSERKLAESTLRTYQGALQMFCDYITSPHYGWVEECEKRFGTHPVQVCHDWNTRRHLADYEGRPKRRPMTRREIQQLFDYADQQVDRAIERGRKGALTAYRDATLFKVLYGWGLRCNEAAQLDVADWYRNAVAPELGDLGMLHVRWGKASRGSTPRRRSVASVMPWAVDAAKDYLTNIRPRFNHAESPALWITERGGRVRTNDIEERFARYRRALGLDEDLTPHCLRHSYATHLIEDGADPKFVQEQLGHVYSSTTTIYSAVSGDFMNTMLRKTLDRALSRDAGVLT